MRRFASNLVTFLVCASAWAQRDGGGQSYFAVNCDLQRDVRTLRSAIESTGAYLLGLAPEGQLIVRATPEQIAALSRMGKVIGADQLRPEEESAREEVVERGLGARRPTREQWDLITGKYAIAEPVAPNELGTMRALLDGGLPATVDNSASMYFPPVRSQGSQGSCTAWAAGYYLNTYVQARDEGLNAASGMNHLLCSPAFLYPLENDGVDDGAYTYSVVRRLNEVGCASWALMPYSANDWTTWPDEAQWLDALKRRTQSFFTLGNGSLNGCSTSEFAAIKQLLANGELLVSDTDVHSVWYNYYPRTTNGIDNAVLYAAAGDYIGGHAMTLVGYDDTRTYFDGVTTKTGAFLFVNSWGTGWGASNTIGRRGFMWVSYELFTNYTGYFGVGYYNSDRTNYMPRLYAVGGLNHPQRGYVRFRGGVGPANSPQWISYSSISNDGGTAIAVTDSKRVAVDLTDGFGYITNLNDVRLYVEMKVSVSASTSGSVAAADFYHDFDGDGHFARVSATNTPFGVPRNSTRFAPIQFGAAPDTNLFVIVTNPPVELTVAFTTTAWDVQGRCGTSVVGHLVWSNWLSGASGHVAAQTEWSATGVPLSVGTNAISFVASNAVATDIVATDSPTNSIYGDGWSSGDGGGAGWGVWTLAAGANAGHFIATRTSNTNLDIAGTAWGLWANSGDSASATRFLAAPLRIGEQMRLLFENHWVDSGRSVGIAWRNSLGEYLVEFLFLGGGTNYLINDATVSRPTGIPLTESGMELVFEWTGANTYRLTSGAYSITGTAAPRVDSEVRQFHVWNYSAGSGANYDLFFSDLMVAHVQAASNVTATATIIRLPPAQWVWEVRSEWGTADPTAGVYTNDEGTVLTNDVTEFDTRGGTQYQCLGWTLANHDVIAGADTQVVFMLTNDTVLTWRWGTNYWLQVAAGEHGMVRGNAGWVPQGAETQLEAVADAYFHFTNWTGDVIPPQQYDNPVWLRMDSARSVSAVFEEDVAVLGTPHWWLASYGWTSEFDQVEIEDADGDGLATWQEWISATDPTDVADVFRARAGPLLTDGYVVEWVGRSNRTYWVHVYTNVMLLPEASIGPFDGPLSIYTDRAYNALSPVYYRVTVER